ncbi:putative heavy metal efflux system protein [Caenibius tardaugens NBRC 16725]|uniref:Putative heavy metal efflux system protein n=1 Tax=Caenibius tardaugens NBRC 16725 TaxID=1219035 RepID=U2ZTZ0_9SPHN|nr:efflux RND transporter periplasmic adaptor subunit [Caenibius tardaugens]AZI36102.1 efflux RND transporter periplasmic adaptor subunit [Caenibius tardaugens NBRC 16725]GAD48819.1 putative heavy metal efflux system protein [Caenibius tardaugens NBRC 16725]
MKTIYKAALPLTFAALLMAGCSGGDPAPEKNEATENAAAGEEAGHEDEEGEIDLTAEQIKAAGIELVRAIQSGGGALTLPATIEGDPQGMQVVSAAIGGRVVSLTRNLGQTVGRGQPLAIIESREAASLNAEIEASRARLSLAESNLRREQRLFDQKVSPEQDLIAARTAATEARIALRLAQQQVAAAGGGGGALNRIAITAPLSGQVVGRSVTLGQTVAADAELFRVANLSRVAVTLALSPADAGKVRPGSEIEIVSGDRRSVAKVDFVSPILDETTRLATVIALIDNRSSQWRVGEPVTASIRLAGDTGGSAASVLVPQSAVQTVEGRSTVFVRTDHGFQAVPVTLGSPSGDNIVVTSGLKGGEQIAGKNSFTLKAELGKGEAEHGH